MRHRLRHGDQAWLVTLAANEPPVIRLEEEGAEPIEIALSGRHSDGRGRLQLHGRTVSYAVTDASDAIWVTLDGQTYRFEKIQSRGGAETDHDGFEAPMPGKILQVNVEPGEVVATGKVLIIMEAMKMEHRIEAPSDGTVTAIHCKAGDLVDLGFDLLDFEAAT